MTENSINYSYLESNTAIWYLHLQIHFNDQITSLR